MGLKTLLPATENVRVLVTLHSILNPIALAEVFPKAQPLEIELGSGDGSFLAEYARRHPERNFIGTERLLWRIRKLERKCRPLGLENVGGVRIESSYFLQYLLPPHAAVALHVYFPDPWPKRKHRRHRLINEAFPVLASQAIAPNGVVYLRTDNEDYFNQMLEVFAASPLFLPTGTPDELAGLTTDFERDFQARGIQTLRAAYQRTSATP